MRLLVFDVDGVLERGKALPKARWEAQLGAIAGRLGTTREKAARAYQEKKALMPRERKETSAYVFMEFGFTREEFFRVLDSVDPASLVEPDDDLKKILGVLSRSSRLVAYSNTPRRSTEKVLRILGVARFFHKVYCADDFAESKPSVNNLRFIMEDNKAKPGDVLLIGDSFEKDILPAREAGIRSILFDPSGDIKELRELLDL